MGKIASNTAIASGAVTGTMSVVVNQGVQATVVKSTVSGLKKGVSVSNQLLSDLEKLVSCVKTQSEKFPKLAEVIASRDMQTKF